MNNIICDIYNKKYCIPTYSGTLAIECILKSLKLNSESKVLISSISCYSILQAVLNTGLKPVIVTPKNGVIFEKKELENIIKKEKIDVLVAVHQYGYYQEIPKLKNVTVIEDTSQLWNLNSTKEIKYESDFIVQSLGGSKPLSNNIGGLIISNNDISNVLDLKKRDNRYSKDILLEYYYPLEINYKKIIKIANKKVKRRRKEALRFTKVFSKYKFIDIFNIDGYIPSYHRYVISVKNEDKDRFVDLLKKCNINFELEYRIKLDELPVVKSMKVKTIKSKTKLDRTFILIKMNNCLFNIFKLKKELKRQYEKES